MLVFLGFLELRLSEVEGDVGVLYKLVENVVIWEEFWGFVFVDWILRGLSLSWWLGR